MRKKKKEDENPLTCVEFRRLVDGLSDIHAERNRHSLNMHEKECLSCNLWLLYQFETLEEVLLDSRDRMLKKSGMRKINKRINRLKKQAGDKLIQPNILESLSDPDLESKAG